MIDKIELIGKIKERINTHGEYNAENDVYTIENAVEESEIDNLADDIADVFMNALAHIENRLYALEKEADEQTKYLPEVFDDLEDAETWNFYEGVRYAIERIRELLPEDKTDEDRDNTATDEEKEIICRPGYHEWNVLQNGVVVYEFEDPVESISDENGEITKERINDFAEMLYDDMEDGTDRDAFVKAVKDGLCEFYL